MDEENQLSAASAFWAVVAIALNTMALPSGKVLGMSSKRAFIYRISPIYCILGTLDACIRLCVYSLARPSLRDGMSAWMDHRFRNMQRDLTHLRSRRETGFAMILFLLGDVAQPIKIFAAGNIAGTHLVCAAYLSNYLVDALIILLAPSSTRPDSSQQQRQRTGTQQRRVRAGLPRSDAIATFTLIVSLVAIPILWNYEISRNQFNSTAWLLMTADLGIWLMAFCGTLTISWEPQRGWACTTLAITALACVLAAGALLIPLQNELSPDKADTGSDTLWIKALAKATPYVLVVCVGIFPMKTLLNREHTLTLDQMVAQAAEQVRAGAFFIAHALALVLWYAYCYDPDKTHRPSWTNYLG